MTDLAKLPAPSVIEPLDYESILAALIADFRQRYPDYTAILESDPAVKILEVVAYRELLLRACINDAARQNLVRFARAPMLDYLGELVGVARLPGEDDERLRERILEAPESFSVAGPRLAYRHHAMSAHASIVDVAVTSPEPGVVRLYPLTTSGLPSAEIKALVLAKASAEDVRPLCDSVEVADPVDMPFTVDARLTVLQSFDAETVRQAALASVTTRSSLIASRLGRDVARSSLIAALHVEGVASVNLVSPNADMTVPETAWAHATSISVTVEGLTDG